MAPNRRAVACLASTGSTAAITDAPDSRAPWIAAMPTPPQPMTATLAPGSTRAVLITAPTPVITPHPTSAAISNGTSSGILTAPSCGTVISSANAPQPAIPNAGVSPTMNRGSI